MTLQVELKKTLKVEPNITRKGLIFFGQNLTKMAIVLFMEMQVELAFKIKPVTLR
jgi:hypothetical protein